MLSLKNQLLKNSVSMHQISMKSKRLLKERLKKQERFHLYRKKVKILLIIFQTILNPMTSHQGAVFRDPVVLQEC